MSCLYVPVHRFKDRTWILGYELLNEPWTGDVYMDASLILPGNAGSQLLEPFYNQASDAIRAV
jgi:endoglycosylceramidase